MKVKDNEVYEDWKSKNKNPYGSGIFEYVERWANLMETEIAKGAKVKDIAEKLSHEADTEGITGYMYGASVSVLSQCWEHGDELRKWHNKEYEYEGEGTVNPAILTIK
ncbi:hypothetical protein [Bacillus sonorensis]|uniref:hypothetical protein n=1 Tax=Bacillus sonorensis TaxID=119858 RepID=UPI001F252A1A|nr:hypothetical protein [Bacillus sonorensis]MCF7618589.1 hypothetical protein [Bacillus sonorensis]MCY7858812.1 hypothetical protein [Bacillus sonorensis]MCY8565666.1 hypothetical protein [Bacillus sonorensis]